MTSCYDCELPYDDKWPGDFVIQHKLWPLISPTHNGGGILCPNCMCKRLMNLGMSAVWVVVNTSEIKCKNNIITKIVNMWLNTWNEYKAWRCRCWSNKVNKENK